MLGFLKGNWRVCDNVNGIDAGPAFSGVLGKRRYSNTTLAVYYTVSTGVYRCWIAEVFSRGFSEINAESVSALITRLRHSPLFKSFAN
jgi:hypothetical protein